MIKKKKKIGSIKLSVKDKEYVGVLKILYSKFIGTL